MQKCQTNQNVNNNNHVISRVPLHGIGNHDNTNIAQLNHGAI